MLYIGCSDALAAADRRSDVPSGDGAGRTAEGQTEPGYEEMNADAPQARTESLNGVRAPCLHTARAAPSRSVSVPTRLCVEALFLRIFRLQLRPREHPAFRGLKNRLRLRNVHPMLPLHFTLHAKTGPKEPYVQTSQSRTLPLHFLGRSVTVPVTVEGTAKRAYVQSHDVSEGKRVGRMSPAA